MNFSIILGKGKGITPNPCRELSPFAMDKNRAERQISWAEDPTSSGLNHTNGSLPKCAEGAIQTT